jgi:hypothetical protein
MSSRKIIIVAPHFPPSNLAGVHRSRLFAQHLPAFGWEPIIVTVHEKYYEEELDWDLEKLVPSDLRIEKVNAFSIKPIKIVGDIGIRGFIPLYQRILKIIKIEKPDFLYIPIPSNFAALLGPLIHAKTGIPYGIDYIDPWVHIWPGSEKKLSKAWLSRKLAEWLEPFAVKNASLISGVAPGYYEAVLQRNPKLKNTAKTIAMPYGGEKRDHEWVTKLNIQPFLFKKQAGILDFVYAGAMLPKAFKPLEELMRAMNVVPALMHNCRIHFIGSGTSTNDPKGYNIKELAQKHGLWEKVFFEYPKRIPYLAVITHLNAADGTFILGSTEAHYTPSKVYQSVLSNKPVFAVLHQESSACKVIYETQTVTVLAFNGKEGLSEIGLQFPEKWKRHLDFIKEFDVSKINKDQFEKYSAKSVTKILANALDDLILSINQPIKKIGRRSINFKI